VAGGGLLEVKQSFATEERAMAKTAVSLRELESKVGQEVGISPWVEMSQERIDLFAKATEDFQWIHVDPARAKDSPFGSTIAHGFLTLSMLPKLSESTFEFSDRKMGVNYGLNRVRFTAPLPAGAKIRGRFTLSKYEKLDGGVQVTWSVSIEREGSDKPVMVAESIGRHYF
jgi:acyl dehydratase